MSALTRLTSLRTSKCLFRSTHISKGFGNFAQISHHNIISTKPDLVQKRFKSDDKPPIPDIIASDNNVADFVGTKASSVLSYFDDVPIIQEAASFLTYVHDTTHLPWWAVIVGVSVSIKIIMFPIFRITKKNSAIPANLPEIRLMSSMAQEPGIDVDKLTKLKKSMKSVLYDRGHRPYKSFLPLLQIPLALLSILGIRLAVLKDPSAAVEGLAWFKDLTSTDLLSRLPLLACAAGLLNQQVMYRMGPANLTSGPLQTAHYLSNFMMNIVLLGVCAAQSQLPQAIPLYTMTTALFNLTSQAASFVYKKINPPPPPPDLDTIAIDFGPEYEVKRVVVQRNIKNKA